eukprot:929437-Heterocapsa_arctica.AAC.1
MGQGQLEVGRREHAQDDREAAEWTRVRPGQALQGDAGAGQHLRHASELNGSMGPMEDAIGVDSEGGHLGRQHYGEQAMEHVHGHQEQGHGIPQLHGQVLPGQQDGNDQ